MLFNPNVPAGWVGKVRKKDFVRFYSVRVNIDFTVTQKLGTLHVVRFSVYFMLS